nr:AAA family ATPase [Borreliella mayonii]
MTTVSIKGGVGRRVIVIIFGHILKNLGKKILLIDLDPQNSLTGYFLVLRISRVLKGQCILF